MGNDQKKRNNGPTKTVNIAESEFHPVETAVENIVTSAANRQPIESDKWHKPNPAVVALANGKRNSVTVTCECCGAEIIAKRPWKRFCNGTCRQRAYQARLAELA